MPVSRRKVAFLAAATATAVLLLGSIRPESQAVAAPAGEKPSDHAQQLPASPDRTMTVLVTDEEGEPLAGAKVYFSLCYKAGDAVKCPHGALFADNDGLVPIRIPPDLRDLKLWPSKSGYVPEFVYFPEGMHDEGELLPQQYHFKLARGTVLSGSVVDEEGRPVPGAKVEVSVEVREPAWGANPDPVISTWLTDSDFSDGSAVTDADGGWSINNAPAREGEKDYEFRLKVTHREFARNARWGELPREQGVTTAMLRDGTAKIVLPRGVKVTGTVVDAAGAPVTKGLVVWSDSPYWDEGTTETRLDGQGRFETKPLKPGEYPITVIASGLCPEQREVNVAAGMEPLRLELAPGKRLAMKIVDRQGHPIPKAYVQIGEWHGGEVLDNHGGRSSADLGIPKSANEDGLFVWDGAPDDAVSYYVSAKGYATTTVSLVAGSGEQKLHVVELAPPLTFSGTVTDARTGEPIAQFRVIPVTVFRPQFLSIAFYDSVVGKNGRYEIPIDADSEGDRRYQVRVEADGYRSEMSERSFGVTDGSVVQDFQLQPAPAREGTVVDADGNPVAGASVVVATPSIVPMMEDAELEGVGGSGRQIKTEPDGRFQLAASWEPMLIRATHPTGFAQVRREPDQPIGRLQLRLWASLAGQLVQDGRPIGNQTVFFEPALAGDVGEPRFQDSYQTQTDLEGRFSFDRLPPGVGSVRAHLGPWEDSPLTSAELVPLALQPGEHARVVLGEGAVRGRNGIAVTGKVVATGRGDTPLDKHWSLNYLVSRDRGVELPEGFPELGFDPAGPMQVAWLHDSHFMEWLATRSNYFVKLSSDGDVHVSVVPAGKYDLVLQLYEQPAGCLVQTVGERVVSIEVTPEDLAAGSKDLGEIEVACRVGPQVGQNMQAYEFIDATGRKLAVYDLRGRYVLMHVWASWCGPCIESMPDLAETVERLSDAPVTFVGLNVDADHDQGRALAGRRGWGWSQTYLGDASAMAKQLAISTVPTYYLIGPDGTLVGSFGSWPDAKRKLEDVLKSTSR